jgi:hypothetical protein
MRRLNNARFKRHVTTTIDVAELRELDDGDDDVGSAGGNQQCDGNL